MIEMLIHEDYGMYIYMYIQGFRYVIPWEEVLDLGWEPC